MPIVALVVPYIFLRIKQSNVDMSAYLERMRGVIMQQITIPVALRSQNNNDILGFLLERLFLGITVATFIASIWNQITPAIHLRSIWFELEERGASCLSLIRWLCTVRDTCKTPAYKEIVKRVHSVLEPVEHLISGGGVAAYAFFRDHRDVLARIRALVGELDAILSIASLKRICFPKYGAEGKTTIVNLRHPLLKNCISNTIADTSKHIILTGPNRGGKSTFLKAYGLATLTAQTWGFCWAKSATVPLYNSIFISLTPAPVLGKTSTFEAEIDAASAICACTDTPQFVMMDEIFHSTNAYDGTAATKIFLDRLYSKQDVTSIISTHYHDVAVEIAGVTQLMMNTGSDLKHSYKVVPGVNKHSSVMEILQERGLCVPTVKQS
jgi:DNA mismatch repair ATPase MutS